MDAGIGLDVRAACFILLKDERVVDVCSVVFCPTVNLTQSLMRSIDWLRRLIDVCIWILHAHIDDIAAMIKLLLLLFYRIDNIFDRISNLFNT